MATEPASNNSGRKGDGSWQIMPAAIGDIGGVRSIDARAGLLPWDPTEYLPYLVREGADFLVAQLLEDDLQIIGFYLAQRLAPEVELLKIGVDPRFHGFGVGQELLDRGLEKARASVCDRCFLEVRESNARALQFYSRNGFRVCGRRKHYYFDPREDAILMQKDLLSGSSKR